MKRTLFFLVLLFGATLAVAQQRNFTHLSWTHVAMRMPTDWYATEEARAIAEIVLESQLPCGGWSKNIPWHRMTEKHHKSLAWEREIGSAIFDNNATTTEMAFLSKVYAAKPDKRYKEAFQRAFELIVEAQYESGGWPMFYPLSEACLDAHGVKDPVMGINYIENINFNDNAHANLLEVMKQIYQGDALFAPLVTRKMQHVAKEVYFKGIQCILDCQIDGRYEQYVLRETPTGKIIADRRVGDAPLSVWCAQHNARTLEPAQARAYEFPSYSGGETAGLLTTLMEVNPHDIPAEYPTMWRDIQRAVKAAVAWLDAHRICDYDYVNIFEGRKPVDRNLVEAKGKRNVWARFYELTTARPIFGMYDFVRLYSLDEVSVHRRTSYGWYLKNMERVLERDYPRWKQQHGIE